jgi:large subunit ribosomal protein L25
MADYKFTATVRKGTGRRWAAELRRQGKLPAVVYGRGEKGLAVEVDGKQIPQLYLRTLGKNTLLTMQLTDESGKTSETTVMFKEVQREPVKGKFNHVDFYHVDMAHPLKLKVPVVLEGVPKGVKDEGGLLSQPTRALTVRCLPADIPAEIRVDVSGLRLEQSLLLQNVTPPRGVVFLDDPHTVLALVNVIEEEKAAPAPGAEGAAAPTPEVITAKKEEGAAAPAAGSKAAPAKK